MLNPHFSAPVLALCTVNQRLSIALFDGDNTRLFDEEVGNYQSEKLLPAVMLLLQETGLSIGNLNALVYAKGPGGFTGLRIALGVLQGFAAAFDTPMIGIPTLDAIAYLAPEKPCVLSAMDARMGEVFYCFFDTLSHRLLTPYQVADPKNIQAPEGFTLNDIAGVGDAFTEHHTLPAQGVCLMPTARDYLALALSGRYKSHPPAAAELLYVRDKVALTISEQIAAREKVRV